MSQNVAPSTGQETGRHVNDSEKLGHENDGEQQIHNLREFEDSPTKSDQKAPKKRMLVLEPRLPPVFLIEKEISKLSEEIINLKSQLNILENQVQEIENAEEFNNQISPGSHDVHFFRGFMISQTLNQTFYQANSDIIKEANNRYLLPSVPKYNHIERIPSYEKVLKKQKEDLPLKFVSVFWMRYLTHENAYNLQMEYLAIQDLWIHNFIPAIDSLNLRSHVYNKFWGEEQSPQPTVPFEGPNATVGVAPDIEMILSYEQYPVNFYDNNRFVEDPAREHLEYKNRVVWSEQDKEKFLDLFWTFPHQFQHISTHFPDKTCKDMIEYYYLTKTSKEMEARKALKVQRMGSKTKKVITEGKVERH